MTWTHLSAGLQSGHRRGQSRLDHVRLQLRQWRARLRQRRSAEKRLREQWGFKGYVVSDCGAVGDIYRSHKYVATEGNAAVAAVKAGTDLSCGGEYRSLLDEVKAGHITEAEITRAAERLFTARMRLGMFDPPDRVPYSKIAYSENDSAAASAVVA